MKRREGEGAMEMIKWPNGARCAVCITPDIDAESLWEAYDPDVQEKTRSLGYYGPLRGVPRILDLYDKYKIKQTFFIPGTVAQKYSEMVKEIHRRGHEIAHHGYSHDPFGKMGKEEEKEFIIKGIEAIKNITGERPVGIRAHGEFAPHTFKNILETGFTYDTSWRGDDRPFRVVIDGKTTDLIEISGHMELDDAPFFLYRGVMPAGSLKMSSTEAAYETWIGEFDGYYEFGLCYVLMLHPQLIGKPGRILMLERLIKHMKSYPDVWFARLRDIAEHWRKTY
jgi:peptidoglycan/xylan/chitin deacetylase (PgdA/CDA1 family)